MEDIYVEKSFGFGEKGGGKRHKICIEVEIDCKLADVMGIV